MQRNDVGCGLFDRQSNLISTWVTVKWKVSYVYMQQQYLMNFRRKTFDIQQFVPLFEYIKGITSVFVAFPGYFEGTLMVLLR